MMLRTTFGLWLPLVLAVLVFSGEVSAETRFDGLRTRLSQDGFEAGWIEEIYARSGVAFDLRSAVSYFRHREASLNYDQFTDAASIEKARTYMEKHAAALARAEKKYGVDQEIITGILLVETRLGTYVGRRSTLNILSSLAALSDEWVRDAAWTEMEKTPQLNRIRFEEWARNKAGWAYRELKAFLTYAVREDLDPAEVMGSYAGAFGIAQFMPTSVLDYAADGNGDGQVNLFHHEDAIASVAKYLKKNGWRPDMNRSQRAKTIYRYNHSDYYVEAILTIADRLKG